MGSLLAVAIGTLAGLAFGQFVGIVGGNLYVSWLDKHVPDWYMRPWWRCWWPRG